MFERYITDALATHFGHIVEDVDADKIRVSAWNGEVILEDVRLRRDALDTFFRNTPPNNDSNNNNSSNNTSCCPVEIVHGTVGTFHVTIPWSVVSSQLLWRRQQQQQQQSSSTSKVETAATTSPSQQQQQQQGGTSRASLVETGCSIVLTDVNILITPRRRDASMVDDGDGLVEMDTTNSSKDRMANNSKNNNDDDDDNITDGLSETQQQRLMKQRSDKEKRVQSILDANLLKRITESSVSSSTTTASSSSTDGSTSRRRWSWIQDWLSSLLSTLSVTVKNIHIRYEDPGTSMGFEWRIVHPTSSSSPPVPTRTRLSSPTSLLVQPPPPPPSGTITTTTPATTNRSTDDANNDDRVVPQPPPQTSSRRQILLSSQKNNNNNFHHHQQQQRYRPAFAVGITLRQFSVHTVAESLAPSTTAAVVKLAQDGGNNNVLYTNSNNNINQNTVVERMGTTTTTVIDDQIEVATTITDSTISSNSTSISTRNALISTASSPSKDATSATTKLQGQPGSTQKQITVTGAGVDNTIQAVGQQQQQQQQETVTYTQRHKLAAAENLAIYWDSDTPLICIRALRTLQQQQQHHRHHRHHPYGKVATTTTTTLTSPTASPSPQEAFQFYKVSFQLLNDGQDCQLGQIKTTPTAAAAAATTATVPQRAKHSYLLDPISPSVHMTLVSNKPSSVPINTTQIGQQQPQQQQQDNQSQLSVGTTTSTSAMRQPNWAVPPASTLLIEMPPCKFTLSRTTLEDTVYLRKSLSIWVHTTKTVLSEGTLRRLARLRPVLSPVKDPTRWWLYAFEATKVLTQVHRRQQGWVGDNYDSNDGVYDDEDVDNDNVLKPPLPTPPHQQDGPQQTSLSASTTSNAVDATNVVPEHTSLTLNKRRHPFPMKRRRRGWIGLVQAVSRRRKYVQLNRQFLLAKAAGDDEDEARRSHQALLRMEDELLPEEIASFRIYVYESSLASKENGQGDRPSSSSSSSSSSPSPSSSSSPPQSTADDSRAFRGSSIEATSQLDHNDAVPLMVKGESDEEILSIEHRRWMMNEMKQALDKEQANRDQRRMAIIEQTGSPLDGEDSNSVVWAASMICREFSVQINDHIGHIEHRGTSGGRNTTPVVRISTALVQNQSWFKDGSWNFDCSLASLEVNDLISAKGKSSGSLSFSKLLGRKAGDPSGVDDEYLLINGIRYPRNISVTVNKRLHRHEIGSIRDGPDIGRGSTTTTKVRVLPMEVVYSTLPVEAVSRVLSTVQTPEIVDDYHRVLAAASSWRDEQRRKLMDALARKDKKIIVDIDIGAPELLIPEDIYRSDSPLLALNLGRFQAYNDDETLTVQKSALFDDQWRVILSNIQVRSTNVANYITQAGREVDIASTSQEQLVESFSMDFVVSTKIAKEDNNDSPEISRISISGTLPRLAFNFTSSAIRLVTRLQQKWEHRKREMLLHAELYRTPGSLITYQNIASMQREEPKLERMANQVLQRLSPPNTDSRISRIFTFEFYAPVITLKLENDVDGLNSDYVDRREASTGFKFSTPLVDLALRGIRGSFVQEMARNGDSATKFGAKLQSLGAIDLFQTAGNDFVLLMSSVPQILLVDQISKGGSYSWNDFHADYDFEEAAPTTKDLVAIEYTASSSKTMEKEEKPEIISIWFHELYVEWNPETLAGIQKAIRTPPPEEETRTAELPNSKVPTQVPDDDVSSSDDEFYDALEDEDGDVAADEDDSVQALSEISSSEDSVTTAEGAFSNLGSNGRMRSSINSLTPSNPISSSLFANILFASSPMSVNSPFGTPHSLPEPVSSIVFPTLETQSEKRDKASRSLKIVFELSKLRVSFNKETRHRKVIVAEMDSTLVSYSTIGSGGSRTTINIGNLIFVDPSFEDKDTLYGQILGLKSSTTDFGPSAASSLLQMEIVLNQRTREFSSILPEDISSSVTIDRVKGRVGGSDCSVNARFSPMRFVLMEQLWFEVMDYFFRGIIGNEVWGGKKVEPVPVGHLSKADLLSRREAFLLGADAEGISFTRFDVTLEAPAILVPVTYSSPEFIRLELSRIQLSNEYIGTVISDAAYSIDGLEADRMQWFNTCKIGLDDLRLFSWSGRELGRKPALGSVILKWPTGPLAPFVVPKWRVQCEFDSLDISLRRLDYALLQNIISYNIGEPSRYMNEWESLQSLTGNVLDHYLKGILVHYGYDKKDVAPTTYDLTVSVRSLTVGLLADDNESSSAVAIARCFDLQWRMQKGSDLVVKQKVICDIDLVVPKNDSTYDKLMSISKYDTEFDEERDVADIDKRGMAYASTGMMNGDNVKKLEIIGATIYLIVPAWKRLGAFFQALTPPILLDRNDIGASIQVGDRWYRIGGSRGNSRMQSTTKDDIIATEPNRRSNRRHSWLNRAENLSVPQQRATRKPSLTTRSPTYQMRMFLLWPRIVLSSVPLDGPPTRVILRMHHFDFLQTKSGPDSIISRSAFFHDVEVYTSAHRKEAQSIEGDNQNSLIHPWSVCCISTQCNERDEMCEKHSYNFSGDVLRARASYSDMAIAIDVILSVLHTAKENQSLGTRSDLALYPVFSGSFDSKDSSVSNSGVNDAINDNQRCPCPSIKVYSVLCNGFEIKVADDSGRHFSGTQDLVILSLGKMLFSREEDDKISSVMNFWLESLDLYDCLQSPSSPFRNAASSHSDGMQLYGSNEKSHHLDGTTTVHDLPALKMSWSAFATKESENMRLSISPEMVARIDEASAKCSQYFSLLPGAGRPSMTGLVEIFCKFSGDSTRDYDVRARSIAVQWNPSTVIAIQRFIGRLRKESKIIAVQVFHEQFDDLLEVARPDDVDKESAVVEPRETQTGSVTKLHIEVDSLTVCLNKEHQNRRLLELNFSSCKVRMRSSDQGMSVEGHLGDLFAFDSDTHAKSSSTSPHIIEDNRNVLKVIAPRTAGVEGEFLHVLYNTFTKHASNTEKSKLPEWVKPHLRSTDDIDDFLSLTVAATSFTYLKERTEEIVDYLSNGLPGKGMGVTSRAAKGFISRRIQTKSFLQLRIDSPQIFVPQHEMAKQGLMLKLGDVHTKSWFEESSPVIADSIGVEWWRILSLRLSGFCSGLLRHNNSALGALSSATNPIDLDILLRKPTVKGRKLSVEGKLSSVELSLCYCDYVLLRDVARDNVSRRIDTETWDNVEKAYWMEEADNELNEDTFAFDNVGFSPGAQTVAYSSNARFVRYGTGGKRSRKKDNRGSLVSQHPTGAASNTLDVRFDLDGLSLMLRRDDLFEGTINAEEFGASFHYDVALLKVDMVEVICTANATGDVSFNLSLFRIGLFDLGDKGRLVRERFHSSLPAADPNIGKLRGIRQPCPFYVLAEGYDSSSDGGMVDSGAKGPQFVVTVDTCPASSTTGFGSLSECGLPPETKVTVARIVINYLSLNALIRPFREIVDYLTCEWPLPNGEVTRVDRDSGKDETKLPKATAVLPNDDYEKAANRGFQLKLVAHYPRVFFLADESDAHSRALVLRGLAVVNVSDVKRVLPVIAEAVDVQHITSLDAQLHGLETYINPDVDEALRFSRRHVDMIGENFSSAFSSVVDLEPSNVDDLLGVALIQPVTTGIEYTQVERELFPTKRSIIINVEPVSTMLSFEDLQLVEVVLNRWSTRKETKANAPVLKSRHYRQDQTLLQLEEGTQLKTQELEVVFHSVRLGLGLKTDQDRVVVTYVESPQYQHQIRSGDILLSIGDENVAHLPLDDVVDILSKSKRPLSVRFQREIEAAVPIISESPNVATTQSEVGGPSGPSSHQRFIKGGTRFSVPCLTQRFHTGMQLGLEFERSLCGQFPVVSKILPTITDAVVGVSTVDETNAEQIEVIESAYEIVTTRLPRVGAVVVAIGNFTVDELGVDQAWLILSQMQQNRLTEDRDENHIAENATVCISFQEIDASVWGKIESLDMSTAGIALSFIDDLKGRDMPLFRAKLSSVDIHVERGIGIQAHILDSAVPSMLIPFAEELEGESLVELTPDEVADIQSESILSLSAVGRCSIDYFHPRVSFWEPCLEPSQLFFLFEKQEGSDRSSRSSQIALEFSDRVLRNQFARGNYPATSYSEESQMVSVNLTDAAAEVFAEASAQWKEWRKGLALRPDDFDIEDLSSESLVVAERPSASNDFAGVGAPHRMPNALEENQSQLVQRAAAKKAAQAALVFAQKRGADTSKNRETAKPFVLRNRTGVSIAFVQQGRGLRMNRSSWRSLRGSGSLRSLSSTIGEYNGLNDYEQQSITELADQEDAKFDMDIMTENLDDDVSLQRSVRHFTNKVRSYEGRYPDLTVAIQAVAGVSVEPIVDLQVFKVGTTIRHLAVKKDIATEDDSDSTLYSIKVVWKVEIQDNRRILTLSTAVRVVSSGFNMSVEVGVRQDRDDRGDADSSYHPTTVIGIARSDNPLYMPLWLALKLEPVSVYVRPLSPSGERSSWSKSSVLHFGPAVGGISGPDCNSFGSSGQRRWTWEQTFLDLTFICCNSGLNDSGNSVWFSVYGASSSQCPPLNKRVESTDRNVREKSVDEVLTVTLDSGLTMRNLLPLAIEWEVSQLTSIATSGEGAESSSHGDKGVDSRFEFSSHDHQFSQNAILQSGECVDVFGCSYNSANLQARFKQIGGSSWSTYVRLALEEIQGTDNDEDYELLDTDEAIATMFPAPCQVNIQIKEDDLGTPSVFGLRIVPKMTLDDPFQGRVYGLEVIIFAELWIRNITPLHLNFGCPSYQLHESGNDGRTRTASDESVARFTAESALMEIANLLEVGDKGTGLNQRAARQVSETGILESLPDQECSLLVEEVFEYVEVESSMVKRRWWASESYDTYRGRIVDVSDHDRVWKWVEEQWAIDCAGGANAAVDGWESCRNLLAGAGSFSTTREFNPSHAFRRRRFFRSRNNKVGIDVGPSAHTTRNPNRHVPRHMGSVQAFHHPIKDSFSREQKTLKRKLRKGNSKEGDKDKGDEEVGIKIAVKCGDGKWSIPTSIPDAGTTYGIIQVLASRWPELTKAQRLVTETPPSAGIKAQRSTQMSHGSQQDVLFKPGCLDSDLFELCYSVADVPGEWGEFSRCMEVSPRFLIRNDSKKQSIKVKQTGAPESSALTLRPGEALPFFWTDFRLPRLVSVLPVADGDFYKWSGGFDLCNLGMTPVRIRNEKGLGMTGGTTVSSSSIRALVEVRQGTGGFGVNVSLREEESNGDGSLFRIENLTSFPIWLAQDGVLANPNTTIRDQQRAGIKRTTGELRSQSIDDVARIDGDLVPPNSRSTFALDVPYMQGKYANRKEATMSELLHVRVALAPLSSRAGVETVKVIGLTTVGGTIRLNPSKLPLTLSDEGNEKLQSIRILGVVATDGPTRVLKFCLMAYPESDATFRNSFPDVSYGSASQSRPEGRGITGANGKDYTAESTQAALEAIGEFRYEKVPNEMDAKRQALFSNLGYNNYNDRTTTGSVNPVSSDNNMRVVDRIYSFRAEFSGFIFSLIDSAPSEIAVASLRNVNALARWNELRTTDASLILSIGWLQVDNHVPSAPFKVAVRPDTATAKPSSSSSQEEIGIDSSPLLVVALAFAPKHKSEILVLRSVTVAPRNLVIGIDLAFLVRLQRYFMGLQDHLKRDRHYDGISAVSGVRRGGGSLVTMFNTSNDQKKTIPFPAFDSPERQLERIEAFGENKKMYFQGLTILPTNIKLSVAPARALTSDQAALEGMEAAAIHEAVRKGDVLVGRSSSSTGAGSGAPPLGVRVGRKNKTPLAVVRGVFKSIVVDALLRLDGASLNFPGVFLRNHIATGSQLTTLLTAHYVSSLKQNVPALLGSLAAIGNPLGLIRGIGDGVSDFVTEPVKGFKRSLKELDPGYVVDGVARGTESLARHTVGGLADSASLLTDTFSKYMAVVTLDRRYAQKRDRGRSLRMRSDARVTLASGVESGFLKLIQGFREGVTGVVKAPLRGAEKRGFQGFAKGLGKGLLGLLVKPIIGISDAATDFMLGVKSTVEYKEEYQQNLALLRNQLRPRRPMYGRDKVVRPYRLEDAAAATLMLRTRCAGENYLGHLDMGDRVALLSVKRLIILGPRGEEQLALKYSHVERIEVRSIQQEDGTDGWGIVVVLGTPRRNGSEVEVITCHSEEEAMELCSCIQRGLDLAMSEAVQT